MSSDFWWGIAVIPIVIVIVCLAGTAIAGLIWASAHFSVNEYKLLKRSQEYNRASMAATIVCAKWIRYCWIPGWHIVICRTTLYDQDSSAVNEQHRRVRTAVQAATMKYTAESDTEIDEETP